MNVAVRPSAIRPFSTALLTLTALVLFGCGAQPEGASVKDDTPPADADAAQGADGLAARGPFTVQEEEYKLDAKIDPRILADRETELWARVFVPKQGDAVADGKLPVLVFLHGNHGTCGTGENPRRDTSIQYTIDGTCPEGFTVTPNHRGYDYIAQNLASWGYVVVSVNANRGITAAQGVEGDFGLNLARGRLVLSHLALLSDWNQNGGSVDAIGVDLEGKLDFEEVGMMGHSRGGEGVRAALSQYREANSIWPAAIGPMTVRGIFEIAPVDGQTSQVLNASDTAWNVLLPMCDGDVADLSGVRPFDRMLRATAEANESPKSTLLVWGANHNFFNTEWQQSDAFQCDADQTPIFDVDAITSDAQRTIGVQALTAFFRGHVGKAKVEALAAAFDPAGPAPKAWVDLTPIGRDFVVTPDAKETLRLARFDGAAVADIVAGAQGVTTAMVKLPLHDNRRGVRVSWTAPTATTGLSLKLGNGAPVDLQGRSTLDVDLKYNVSADNLDFTMRLVTAGGQQSQPVALSSFVHPQGTVGRNLLQTVRIPLSAFGGVDLTSVSSLRLTFDKSANGRLELGDVRSTARSRPVVAAPALAASGGRGAAVGRGGRGVDADQTPGRARIANAVLDQAAGSQGPDGRPLPPYVKVTLRSDKAFPIRDELPTLMIDGQAYKISGYVANDPKAIVFSVPAAKWRQLPTAGKVEVVYGERETSNHVIEAGSLSEDLVRGVQ
jgi:hypothetical protein